MNLSFTVELTKHTHIRQMEPAKGDCQVCVEHYPSSEQAGYSSLTIFVADKELADELVDVLRRCKLSAIRKGY